MRQVTGQDEPDIDGESDEYEPDVYRAQLETYEEERNETTS